MSRPVIRVERGDPDAEELAALLVALEVVGADQHPTPRRRLAGWCRPHRAGGSPVAQSWQARTGREDGTDD